MSRRKTTIDKDKIIDLSKRITPEKIKEGASVVMENRAKRSRAELVEQAALDTYAAAVAKIAMYGPDVDEASLFEGVVNSKLPQDFKLEVLARVAELIDQTELADAPIEEQTQPPSPSENLAEPSPLPPQNRR